LAVENCQIDITTSYFITFAIFATNIGLVFHCPMDATAGAFASSFFCLFRQFYQRFAQSI